MTVFQYARSVVITLLIAIPVHALAACSNDSQSEPIPTAVIAEQVTVVNDGVIDGRPQVTIDADVAIDVVIASPNSHEEPVFQDAGSRQYLLHTDLDTGAESVTLTVVVFEAGTDNRLAEETFTWERME